MKKKLLIIAIAALFVVPSLALAAVEKTRFLPATQDGKAVPSETTFSRSRSSTPNETMRSSES